MRRPQLAQAHPDWPAFSSSGGNGRVYLVRAFPILKHSPQRHRIASDHIESLASMGISAFDAVVMAVVVVLGSSGRLS